MTRVPKIGGKTKHGRKVNYLCEDRRINRICPVCHGRAWSHRYKCDNCNNTGRLSYKEKTIESHTPS